MKRILAISAAAITAGGIALALTPSASASTAHWENHSFSVAGGHARVIDVTCSHNGTMLNFRDSANANDGQVQGTILGSHGRTTGDRLAVAGPISFEFDLLCA